MIFYLVRDFTDLLDAMPNEHPRRRMTLWNLCWWYDGHESGCASHGEAEFLVRARQHRVRLCQETSRCVPSQAGSPAGRKRDHRRKGKDERR